MKKVLLVALAMLVAFASCKKKTEDPVTPVTPTVAISIPGIGGDKRVTINEEIEAYVLVEYTATTINNVKLYYTVEGGREQTIEMIAGEYTLSESTYNYKAIIPAQDKVTTLTWYAIATEKGGLTAESATLTVGIEPPMQLDIVLNEICGLDGEKFIELYNPTLIEVNISGYQIKKDDKEEATWTAKEGLTIPAESFLLLYSEDVVLEDQPHYGYDPDLVFASGISPKKTVKIELLDESGENVDTFTRGIEPWGTKISEVIKAFARTPNSYGDWKLAEMTPGTANPDTGDDIPQE